MSSKSSRTGVHVIETGRLIIRRFKVLDYADLHEYLSDPSIYLYEPGQPINLQQARELAAERSRGDAFRAVILKSENRLIGHLVLEPVEPHELQTWELGYIFNRRYHGHGYATEAATALVAQALADPSIHRIRARCNPENVASWKLLERIGFTREGYFRKCGFFRRDGDGRPLWFDAYEYARLQEDT